MRPLPYPKAFLLFLITLTAKTAHGNIIFPDTISSTADQAAGTLWTNAINGSGFSEPLTEANYSTLTHVNGYTATVQWLSNAIDGQTVTFGFNSPAPRIDQILLWNYTQIGRQDRSNESVSKVEVDTGAGFVDLGMNFSLADWDGTSELSADVLEIGPQIHVNAIRITLEQNDGSNGEYAGGLNEVAFRGGPVTAIDPRLSLPGPITWPGQVTSLQVELNNAGDSNDLTVTDIRVGGTHAEAFSISSEPMPLVIPHGEHAMIQLHVDPSWFHSLPVTLDARLEVDSDTPFQPTSYAPHQRVPMCRRAPCPPAHGGSAVSALPRRAGTSHSGDGRFFSHLGKSGRVRHMANDRRKLGIPVSRQPRRFSSTGGRNRRRAF